MTNDKTLIEPFEKNRTRLRALAYRMLGSLSDAEDAIHDSWLRMCRQPVDLAGIQNMEGWLTTVVARVCLNKLRARKARPEDSAGLVLPDLLIADTDESGPEHDIQLAEQVGLALQVVLETLSPAEGVAFVLHDLFDLPFEEIAAMLNRTPQAARKLASRGRQRVQGIQNGPVETDRSKQRAIVEAFFAASQRGDLDSLLQILDPEVTFVADGGVSRSAATATIHGSGGVARRAISFAIQSANMHWVLVNGSTGVIVTDERGRPQSVMVFIVTASRISRIYALLDPERLGRQIAATKVHLNRAS